MSGVGADETRRAADLWPDVAQGSRIGRWRRCGAGWVETGAYRSRGGSGGMLSWLATEILRQGLADAVLHVRPLAVDGDAPDAQPLFSHQIADTVAAKQAGDLQVLLARLTSPIARCRAAYNPSATGRSAASVRLGCAYDALRSAIGST